MKHVYRLLLIFSLFLPFTSSAERPFNVTYEYESELHVVTGKAYKNGILFNNDRENVVRLVTLNWPPYIDDSLCNKGWVYQLTVALFHQAGYGVYIEFLPWARAVREAELGKADVLFPEYFIEANAPSDVVTGMHRTDLLRLSAPIPGGEINFLKRKDTELEFNGNLLSIINKMIGVVRGYQNTPEFDALMDAGKLNIVEAVDDLQLSRLLMNKRVEIIIGDPQVIQSSILMSEETSTQKRQWLTELDIVEPSLAYNPLYFAISKRVKNSYTILENINDAINRFKQTGTLNRIIETAKSQCHQY